MEEEIKGGECQIGPIQDERRVRRDIEEEGKKEEGREGRRLIGGIRMDAKKSWNDQVANPSSHVRPLPRRTTDALSFMSHCCMHPI